MAAGHLAHLQKSMNNRENRHKIWGVKLLLTIDPRSVDKEKMLTTTMHNMCRYFSVGGITINNKWTAGQN